MHRLERSNKESRKKKETTEWLREKICASLSRALGGELKKRIPWSQAQRGEGEDQGKPPVLTSKINPADATRGKGKSKTI